ncbi:MAG: FecR domain-containing protein [Archangium sp.]
MSAHDQAQLYLDGRLSAEERVEFESHLAGCAECQALVNSWRSFSASFARETAPHLAPPDDLSTRRLINRAKRGAPLRPVVMGLALAAAAVALIFALRPQTQTPVAVATLEATTESRREVLGDDTIGLTPGSAVELPERTATRVEVKLLRGSVAASVKKRAPGSSFVVRAGDCEVKVVGTRFRVERQNDGVRVSVIEGLVRVSKQGAEYDVAAGETLSLDSTTATRAKFTRAGFKELGEPDDEVAPVEVDAGVEEPDAGVSAPTPSLKPVSAAQLSTWRQAAASNQCAKILPEVQRSANEHRRQAAVWRVLADCQRLTQDAKSARTSYEQVITVGTSDDAARARPVLAALLQEELGAHEAAIKVLNDYLRGKPSPVLEASARVRLARSYLALGKKPQAKKELERVVKELPSSPPALEALELLKTL